MIRAASDADSASNSGGGSTSRRGLASMSGSSGPSTTSGSGHPSSPASRPSGYVTNSSGGSSGRRLRASAGLHTSRGGAPIVNPPAVPRGFAPTKARPAQDEWKRIAHAELFGQTFESLDLPERLCGSFPEQLLLQMKSSICSKTPFRKPSEPSSEHRGRAYYFPSVKMAERSSYPGISLLWDSAKTAFVSSNAAPYAHSRDLIIYDRVVKNGGVFGYGLKPDLVIPFTTFSIAEKQGLTWSEIITVCEVKKSWPELIQQATIYAKCLFTAHPSRSYVPVIGFNHTTFEFCFLFFHHSGLTGSPLIQIIDAATGAWIDDAISVFARWAACILELQSGRHTWMSQSFSSTLSTPSTPAYPQSPTTSPPSKTVRIDFGGTKAVSISVCPSVSGRSTRITRLESLPPSPDDVMDIGGSAPPSINWELDPVLVKRYEAFTDDQTADVAYERDDVRGTSINKKRHAAFLKKHRQISPIYAPRTTPDFAPPSFSSLIVKESWPARKTRERGEASEDTEDMEGSEAGGESGIETGVDGDAVYEPEILSECNGEFGHVLTLGWQLLDDTSIFKGRNWNAFNDEIKKSDFYWIVRVRMVVYMITYGKRLVEVPTPVGLVEVVLHAMIGHHIMFRKGYIHHDISNGNILWLPSAERRRSPRTYLKSLPDMTECSGILIDADLAQSIRNNKALRKYTFSGTPEFLSHKLHKASTSPDPDHSIQHTPADDLQSAVWVLVWEILGHFHRLGCLTSSQNTWLTLFQSSQYNDLLLAKMFILEELANDENILPQIPEVGEFLRLMVLATSNRKLPPSPGLPDAFTPLYEMFFREALKVVGSEDGSGHHSWQELAEEYKSKL